MIAMRKSPGGWLKVTPAGLYCAPGDFHIDPLLPVERAVITHGHADHARAGHRQVIATAPTLAIMRQRRLEAEGSAQCAGYGETLPVGDVKLTLLPAGHILGSCQVMLDYGGSRVIVSGDYKRRRDPTCEPFRPERCDVFVTEATFGLPIFHHPPEATQIAKLLHARALYPERCILLGAYALGKCQRLLCLLREAGYMETVYLHGAMIALCDLYRAHGVELGPLEPLGQTSREALKGKIVVAPPSALHDRWSRRLPDPVTAMASGWLTVRARARQRRVELPLVVSDHADWDELIQTIRESGASEIWVTHGREDALVHYARTLGLRARPLDLHGYDENEE